jgi:hypothetical protein
MPLPYKCDNCSWEGLPSIERRSRGRIEGRPSSSDRSARVGRWRTMPDAKKTAPEGATVQFRLRAPATPRYAEADEGRAQERERRRLWNRISQRQRGGEHRRCATAFAVDEVEGEGTGGPRIRHGGGGGRGWPGGIDNEKAADQELETVVMVHCERLPVDNADQAHELDYCSTVTVIQISREVRRRARESDFARATRKKGTQRVAAGARKADRSIGYAKCGVRCAMRKPNHRVLRLGLRYEIRGADDSCMSAAHHGAKTADTPSSREQKLSHFSYPFDW